MLELRGERRVRAAAARLRSGGLERLWERRLAERLEAIVISHMHMDHMLDLLLVSPGAVYTTNGV